MGRSGGAGYPSLWLLRYGLHYSVSLPNGEWQPLKAEPASADENCRWRRAARALPG